MSAALYISLGAIVGANARYFLTLWAIEKLAANFPYGTLIVNVTGSFLIGLFVVLIGERVVGDTTLRLLLVTGFCGGYTTFSTYAYEAVALAQGGAYGAAAVYVVGSVALSLVAVVGGALVGRLV